MMAGDKMSIYNAFQNLLIDIFFKSFEITVKRNCNNHKFRRNIGGVKLFLPVVVFFLVASPNPP